MGQGLCDGGKALPAVFLVRLRPLSFVTSCDGPGTDEMRLKSSADF